MIGSVLIANRGEIARRVIRTSRRLGVKTIAVHSEADARAAFVREANVAVEIGPAIVSESYLSADRIPRGGARHGQRKRSTRATASFRRTPPFAEAVEAAGLVWVGPPPAAIRAMGLKDAAKRLMADAGVPVTPGWLGEDQAAQHLAKEAANIGWPVLIKAVAGGGGKGMRKVERAGDFADALASAKREAKAAFGDDRVLLEKYVGRPRHIEVQVFADAHGGVVHLFERDCTRDPAPIPESDQRGSARARYGRGNARGSVCGGGACRQGRELSRRRHGRSLIADASEGLSG